MTYLSWLIHSSWEEQNTGALYKLFDMTKMRNLETKKL